MNRSIVGAREANKKAEQLKNSKLTQLLHETHLNPKAAVLLHAAKAAKNPLPMKEAGCNSPEIPGS